ncbi:MAG TPA: LacI family DNA-binding transcriptional regulator [Capsulimonadaceae bacterium]|jgi:LacI family transcriptional regulator
MTQKRTSTRDIAAAAGVSQATVSNVLSGRSRLPIAEATRQRVLQTAEELRYRPNRLAAGMFRGKTSMIGVILPDVGGSFYGDMLRGIQHACMMEDCVTLLSYTQSDARSEEQEANRLLEHRVDGLLVAVSRYTLAGTSVWLDDMRVDGIPCVMLDDRSYSPKMDVVASDDVDGAYQAVKHLTDLGHRRIAFISGPEGLTTFRDRQLGYEKALAECGIELDPALVTRSEWDYNDSPITPWLANLLASPNRPTALFAVSDYHAEVVIRWMRSEGLSVPGDLSVVGYAGTELSKGLDLTTVHQDSYNIGLTAASRLFHRTHASSPQPTEVLLPTWLIVRKSSGPALI